jgi:hypothetical protein
MSNLQKQVNERKNAEDSKELTKSAEEVCFINMIEFS